MPGGAAEPGSSPRGRWTRQYKALAIFLGGSVVAGLVLLAAANPPSSADPTGGTLSGNAAAVPGTSGAASAPDPNGSAGALAPVAIPVPGASASAHGSAPTAHHPAASLAELPVNTALAGSEAVAWARAALAALGAPETSANIQTMVDWFANEGTPHDLNNPLNLQTPYGGSTVSTADGDPPSVRIQAYPAPADFVAAFPIEMNNGSYPAIVAALKSGVGLEGSAATPEIAAELSVYSGGGYSSIPASGD